MSSPSHEVTVTARLAARDLRSNLGANLSNIEALTSKNPWTMTKHECKMILAGEEMSKVPTADLWRLRFLTRLLTERLEAYYGGDNDDYDRLSFMIN